MVKKTKIENTGTDVTPTVKRQRKIVRFRIDVWTEKEEWQPLGLDGIGIIMVDSMDDARMIKKVLQTLDEPTYGEQRFSVTKIETRPGGELAEL